MPVEIYVNKMSEHMDSAEIIQWLAHEGEVVVEHQPILEVMTDKFTVELESPADGILAGIRPGCEAGTTVPVGEPIAYIVKPGESAPQLAAFGTAVSADVPEVAAANLNGDNVRIESEPAGRVKSTPVARKMAREAGIEIESLRGTGPSGRVMEADIAAAIEARLRVAAPASSPAPQTVTAQMQTQATPADVAPRAEEGFTWMELTPIQRITGGRMHESVVNAPQFSLEMSADATNLLWLKEALDARIALEARARLTLTGLLVKVVAAVLERHPRVNAEFSAGRVKQYGDANVGVAVGTEQGLAVPVVKRAQSKTLAQVTSEMAAFQEKARTLHFTADDLSGGTFTVSNLGMFGVERFAAIVNPPQAAILAIGAVVRTPVVVSNDTVAVRPRMVLTLTVDHRVLDGVQAARFLAEVKDRIEEPYFVI